jgi:hypothetical protein
MRNDLADRLGQPLSPETSQPTEQRQNKASTDIAGWLGVNCPDTWDELCSLRYCLYFRCSMPWRAGPERRARAGDHCAQPSGTRW